VKHNLGCFLNFADVTTEVDRINFFLLKEIANKVKKCEANVLPRKECKF
jgi:hypothetical protein